MLPRLVKNSTFWIGVVLVVISLGLMIVSEMIAALGALLGLGLVIYAVVMEARWKPDAPRRKWSDEKKKNVIDLD